MTNLSSQFTQIINDIPFNRILGLQLDAIEKNFILMSFPMNEKLIGNFMHGILHGGVISAVLDMAGGTAAMAAAIQKRTEKNLTELAGILGKSSTISLHIDYIQPGKGHTFTARAEVLHSGSKVTFARMELFNQEKILIATGSAAYRVG